MAEQRPPACRKDGLLDSSPEGHTSASWKEELQKSMHDLERNAFLLLLQTALN